MASFEVPEAEGREGAVKMLGVLNPDMPEVLVCPKCGETPVPFVDQRFDPREKGERFLWFCFCSGCIDSVYSMGIGETLRLAVLEWNEFARKYNPHLGT